MNFKNWNKYLTIGMFFLVSGKFFDYEQTLLLWVFLIIGLSFSSYGLYIFFRDKKNPSLKKPAQNFSKKSMQIAFGIFCVVLGMTTDSSNFIPAIFKYLIGAFFIFLGLFYSKNDIDKSKEQ